MHLKQKLKSSIWEWYVQAMGLMWHGDDNSLVQRIIIYHNINAKDQENFERQIQFYKENFDVVSLSEFLDRMESSETERGGLLTVTFDDAYASVYELAVPILDKYDVKPCIFVPVGYLETSEPDTYQRTRLLSDLDESPMSWMQLRELREKGYEVGGHSWDHVNFNQDGIDYEKELLKSRQELTQQLNLRIKYFAFPFGSRRDISEKSLSKVKEYGYEKAFSGERLKICRREYLYPRTYINPSWNIRIVQNVLNGMVDCNGK